MVAPITELRGLVRDTVLDDATLFALLTGFYDDAPKDVVSPYVTFGPSDFNPFDPTCITAGDHSLQIDVWSENKPRKQCEDICHAIKKLLHLQTLNLTVHALGKITASSRVIRDPDGITNHGIISIQAFIEER